MCTKIRSQKQTYYIRQTIDEMCVVMGRQFITLQTERIENSAAGTFE